MLFIRLYVQEFTLFGNDVKVSSICGSFCISTRIPAISLSIASTFYTKMKGIELRFIKSKNQEQVQHCLPQTVLPSPFTPRRFTKYSTPPLYLTNSYSHWYIYQRSSKYLGLVWEFDFEMVKLIWSNMFLIMKNQFLLYKNSF